MNKKPSLFIMLSGIAALIVGAATNHLLLGAAGVLLQVAALLVQDKELRR